MGKMDEQIIVVKRSALFGDGPEEDLVFQGTEKDRTRVETLSKRIAGHYEVMRRGDAENNPAYKQPIPYAVIRKGDDFFTYKRLGGGGEERLHGKMSLGVGGHMNQVPEAKDFASVLAENLQRELNEELVIKGGDEMTIRTVGLINDDANDVGKVHIGVLAMIDLPLSAQVEVREKDKLEGKWLKIDALSEDEVYQRLESWSAFAVDTLQSRLK